MPEEEIEQKAAELDQDPIPGLGEPGGDGDDEDEADGFVCMPADLVKE